MDSRLREIIDEATELAAEYGAKLGSHEQNKKSRVVLRIVKGDEHRTLYWPMDRGNWRTEKNLRTQAHRVLEAWLGPPIQPAKPERIAPDPHTKDTPRNGHPTPPRPIATQALDMFTSPFELVRGECFSAVIDGNGRTVCHTPEHPEAVWLAERLNHAKVPMHRKERAIVVSTLEALAGEYRRRESLHLKDADAALDAQDEVASAISVRLADAFAFAAGTLESLIQSEMRKDKSKTTDEREADQHRQGFQALSRMR